MIKVAAALRLATPLGSRLPGWLAGLFTADTGNASGFTEHPVKDVEFLPHKH